VAGPALVREMTLGDRPAVRELRRRVWHKTYSDTWSHDLIDALFDGEVELTFERTQEWVEPYISRVATIDGAMVGAATAAVLADGEGELVSLYVLAAHHGSGVAQQLWDEVVEALRKRGCASMQIWVVANNPRAIRFYEKLGSVAFSSSIVDVGGVSAECRGYRFTFPPR
jgi:ribosomal protein S18 acetylase RimI-like enzyme